MSVQATGGPWSTSGEVAAVVRILGTLPQPAFRTLRGAISVTIYG